MPKQMDWNDLRDNVQFDHHKKIYWIYLLPPYIVFFKNKIIIFSTYFFINF